MSFLQLAMLQGRESLRETAVGTISLAREALGPFSLSFGYMLSALEFYLAAPTEVVVAGNPESTDFQEMREEVHRRFLPNTIVAVVNDTNDRASVPFLEGKHAIAGKATAYVCESFTCRAPVTSLAELVEQLDLGRL